MAFFRADSHSHLGRHLQAVGSSEDHQGKLPAQMQVWRQATRVISGKDFVRAVFGCMMEGVIWALMIDFAGHRLGRGIREGLHPCLRVVFCSTKFCKMCEVCQGKSRGEKQVIQIKSLL